MLKFISFGLFYVLMLFQISNCNPISNFFECNSPNCPKNYNRMLALLGLLNANSCELPSEGSNGGLQDDPSQYDSFTGRIANTDWNETYIRKILHTFAWGGFVRDNQIQEWVNMGPSRAIIEIINANPVNPKMNQPLYGSPAATSSNASLYCLSKSLASGAYIMPPGRNANLHIDNRYAANYVFPIIAQLKGLNPVRQVIGYMETNYHVATNSRLVGARPQFRLYDEMMNLIAKGESYDRVLAHAALSPAIAIQYNHKKNRFEKGEFKGNEDFAREFHQLLFGILGGSTTGSLEQTNTAFAQHENVTIPETAKALTDIRIGDYKKDDPNLDTVEFGTEYHLDRAVTVYGMSFRGANAKEKIYNIAKESIVHNESLRNLPLKIVRFLADDNLDENDITETSPNANQIKIQQKANIIKNIWATLPQKNLLMFLRRYALSTAFYNETRIKYRTSAERIFTISNLVTFSNSEISAGLHATNSRLSDESITTFFPTHEVFGGQTGIEAKETADVFKWNYNTTSQNPNQWGIGNLSTGYKKPYDLLIPKDAEGKWRVKNVAEWLWNYFIGDGLAKFGNLERAHLYALLSSGTDLSYFLAKDKKDPTINTKIYSYGDGGPLDIANDNDLKQKIDDAGFALLRLDDPGTLGDEARVGVGLAINFIISTPYIFVIEGK